MEPSIATLKKLVLDRPKRLAAVEEQAPKAMAAGTLTLARKNDGGPLPWFRIPTPFANLCVLVTAFVCSRVFYLKYQPIRFQSDTLNYFLQYLDPHLLKTDLLSSVYYTHFQPPAFNLFLGTVLKLFPTSFPTAFQVIYLLMGMAFSLVLFLVLTAVGTNRTIALTLAVIHTILPTTVLYENWLFYSYPLALLFCLSAYFLVCFLKSYKRWWGILFFSTLALISCIHAMFGMIWWIVILCALLLCNKTHKVRILQCAVFPLLVVLGLEVKQYALFGRTTGSTYLGLNLACRLAEEIPDKAVLPQIDEVSPFFFTDPCQPVSAFQLAAPPVGIPVLDQERKSTGWINFNHPGYFQVADADMRGVRYVLQKHPEYYLHTFLKTNYFHPASEDIFVKQRVRFDPASNWGGVLVKQELRLLRATNAWLCGQSEEDGPGWLLVIALPLLVMYGLVRMWKSQVIAFIILNILYSSILTLALTFGDWNRYRFTIDAFYVVLLGLLLTSLMNGATRMWTWFKNRHGENDETMVA